MDRTNNESLDQSRWMASQRRICLDNEVIDDSDMIDMIAILSAIEHLKMLDLSVTNITDVELGLLAPILNTKKLEQLCLGSNIIKDVGKPFSMVLAYNTSLRVLDLSDNQITRTGMKLIGESLQTNSCLEWLVLDRTDISDDGVLRIMQALQSNHASHLSDLSLINCNITDFGASIISMTLNSRHSLKSLDLVGNLVTDIGLEYLIQELGFDKLQLGINCISPIGIKKLRSLPYASIYICSNNQKYPPSLGVFETMYESLLVIGWSPSLHRYFPKHVKAAIEMVLLLSKSSSFLISTLHRNLLLTVCRFIAIILFFDHC